MAERSSSSSAWKVRIGSRSAIAVGSTVPGLQALRAHKMEGENLAGTRRLGPPALDLHRVEALPDFRGQPIFSELVQQQPPRALLVDRSDAGADHQEQVGEPIG